MKISVCNILLGLFLLCPFWLFGCTAQVEDSDLAIDSTQDASSVHHGAFEKFKSTAAIYDITSRETEAFVEFDLIARDSAVIETWVFPSGDGDLKEVSVFYMDGGRLKATHHCASGILSNLVFDPDADRDRYVFKTVSTSTLATPDTAFNSGFAYKFDNEDIIRDEYWTEAGVVTPSHLTLTAR